MELPQEVRDMIYEACLAFDGAIFVRDKRIRRTMVTSRLRQRQDFDRRISSIASSATAKGRSLFHLSRQIRDEAVPIFYRKNTFEFTSLTEMEKFIHNMGLRYQHNLRSVIVYYEAEYLEFQRPLSLLAQCVGLRDLTLILGDACVEYTNSGNVPSYKYDWAALQKPPAFSTLLRIRGLDTVRLVLSRRAGALVDSTSKRDFELLPAMEAAVQVMKKPRPVPQKRMKPNKVKKRAQKKRKSASK